MALLRPPGGYQPKSGIQGLADGNRNFSAVVRQLTLTMLAGQVHHYERSADYIGSDNAPEGHVVQKQ